jgi:hypothetical protein
MAGIDIFDFSPPTFQTWGIEPVWITGFGPAAPPVIVGVSPAGGSSITSGTTLSFSVTDSNYPLRLAIVAVSLPTLGIYEIAHDGTAFGPMYQGPANNRLSLSPASFGYSYTILRQGGWPASPTVVIFAVDTGGFLD